MPSKLKLKPIADELIIERLKFENPWWTTSQTDSDYQKLKRRKYFDIFSSLVSETDVKRAVVLMGPRRVGKTVIMHHTIQFLLDNKINPQNICFINIENPIYNNISLEHLFALSRKAASVENPKGWFVFFDEIQYLKDWEIHLKVLVDSYPNTKFIVSGSAAAALKMKSKESGAGRFTDFMLPPLTFHEYIYLKDYEHLMRPSFIEWKGDISEFYTTINKGELNRHFLDYINFGGYPEVIFSDKIRANPGRYIKSDIIDKVLLRDLPSLYGIQDVQELNSFFSTLAYYSGNELSLDALSKSSGVQKNLLKKYLEYLQAAFLIRIVHRVDDNAKKFQRATFFKVYLSNPSLRSALYSPLNPTDDMLGNMVETAIYAQWMHRDWFIPYYARWTSGKQQGEIDMIGLDEKKLKPMWALEIKWSNRFYDNSKELKSLISFCTKNKLSSALVTTIDKEGTQVIENININFVPSSVYAYVVGKNTLEHKSKRY